LVPVCRGANPEPYWLIIRLRRCLATWALAAARGVPVRKVLRQRGLSKSTFYRKLDGGAARIAAILGEINEQPNVLFPVEFARRATRLRKLGVDVEVLDVKASSEWARCSACAMVALPACSKLVSPGQRSKTQPAAAAQRSGRLPPEDGVSAVRSPPASAVQRVLGSFA
jgi:hypothetical protein